MPGSRFGIRTVGGEDKDGAGNVGFLLHIVLCLMDSSNPAGALRVAVGHLPVGVEHPFSLEYLQQAPGVGRGVRVLHGEFGEEAAGRGDGRKHDVLHEPTEVPVEERTVQYQGGGSLRRALAEVIGGNQAAGRVGHEDDLAVPLRVDGDESGVDIREVFRQVFAEESILMGEERASVLAEVEGVEVIAVGQATVAQLGLKEVIVVAVDVEDGAVRVIAVERLPDQGTNHAALVIVGHLEGARFVAVAQQVGSVLRRDGCEEAEE